MPDLRKKDNRALFFYFIDLQFIVFPHYARLYPIRSAQTLKGDTLCVPKSATPTLFSFDVIVGFSGTKVIQVNITAKRIYPLKSG